MRFELLLGIAAALSIVTAARAQATDSAAKSSVAIASEPRDTLFLRARRLVAGGNGAAGRSLVDSALAAAVAGTTEYATALYWRGALSSTAADAERDYRRVIVEYPFSPHSGDALLALAQLEMARGERDAAIDHLERFLLQRPNDPERVHAGIWLGRMLLEQNQLAKGCAVLSRTRASLGDAAVETRNQVDYYAARCAGVDTTPPAPRPAVGTAAPAKTPRSDSTSSRHPSTRDTTRPDSTRRQTAARGSLPRADSAARRAPIRDTAASRPRRRDSTKSDSAHRKPGQPNANAPAASGRYTIQVAAYDTRQAAEQLVTRLSARGIVARIAPSTTAPYRVRVGRYATDAAATAVARELKEKGIVGFVTTTDNESAPAPVRR
ncbi:MAG TPA: SPOR domain-containing protein [Gemmatimonadaceae bacterium]|nr:SPOR domain-containing protein [Gemmatimonadaceae bacterium]